MKSRYGKTPQSTDRIARSTPNVAICRTFSRVVLLLVVDRQWIITDRSRKYRPLSGHMESAV